MQPVGFHIWMGTEETMETNDRETMEETLRGTAESIGRAVDLLQRRLLELNVELDDLKRKENPDPATPQEYWDCGQRDSRHRLASDEADDICMTLGTLNKAVRQLSEISAWEARK